MLALTNLVGLGGGKALGGSLLPLVRHLGNFADTNTNNGVFVVDTGAPKEGRIILNCLGVRDPVNDAFDVSMTLSGNSMTEVNDAGSFGASSNVAAVSQYIILPNTLGGDKTVASTLSGFTGTANEQDLVAFELNGLDPTRTLDVSDSDTSNGNPVLPGTFNTSTSDAVILAAVHQTGGNVGSWTGGNVVNISGLPQWLAVAYDVDPPDSSSTDYDLTGTVYAYAVCGFARL